VRAKRSKSGAISFEVLAEETKEAVSLISMRPASKNERKLYAES